MASREQFIAMLLPAAIQASKQTGVDPRLIVAQAAQETGWGRSAPGNNYFGIKSHGQGGGQTFTTHEVIDGKRVKINDSFRQFESPADSVMGYADFITKNKRYAPMRQAQGLDAQLQALGASGYATDPNYAQSVGAIAKSIPLDGSIPTNPIGPLGGDSMVARDHSPQVAAQTNAPIFGSMSPSGGGMPGGGLFQPPAGPPSSVSEYAFADDEKKENRFEAAGKLFSKAMRTEAPNPGQFPGGPSAAQAGGLLKMMQDPQALARLMMQRRVG